MPHPFPNGVQTKFNTSLKSNRKLKEIPILSGLVTLINEPKTSSIVGIEEI